MITQNVANIYLILDRDAECEDRLQGGVSICPHDHDIHGSEQGQRLTGSLFRGGVTQDGLHLQLQHVSLSLVLLPIKSAPNK